MLALVWPASWALLIPIVVIEGAIARSYLGVSWRRSLGVSGAANFVSTLLGIPMTWGLGVVAESLVAAAFVHLGRDRSAHPSELATAILMAPWLGSNGTTWMVVVASIVLCIPFFFASVWIEFLVANAVLREIETAGVKGWAWRANAASYGGIVVLLLGLLAWTLSS